MKRKSGFSLKVRDESELDKMKNYRLVNRFHNYDLLIHNNKYIFLDAVKLELYTVKTKWNLLDNTKFKDLINLYEFFYWI